MLPGILCRQREGEQKDSIVIVVSPLIALIRDQLQKLKDYVNVCVLQSIVEDEGESIRLTLRSHKMLTNAVCCLVIRRFLLTTKPSRSCLKGKDFQTESASSSHR